MSRSFTKRYLIITLVCRYSEGIFRRVHLFFYSGHHSASRYSPYHSPTSNSPFSPLGNRPIRPKPFCVDVGTNTSLPGCVNGRSPDLPANPSTWSVEQVVRYVRSTDCLHYANIFLDQVNACSYTVMFLY